MNFYQIVDWYENHNQTTALCAIRDVANATLNAYAKLPDPHPGTAAHMGEAAKQLLYVQAALQRCTPMTALIAVWSSRAGKWTAHLYKQADGYRLSERKHGSEVGGSYRPFSLLPDDDYARGYFDDYVDAWFDVPMKRVP